MPTRPDQNTLATGRSDGTATTQPPVDALVGALPLISRYVGKTIVVKVGGSIGDEGTVLEDLAALWRLGVKPVVVHGGGALISSWLERLGQETRFVDGRRYTDGATLDVVRMVLIGLVNNDLVAGLNARGVRSVGLSGVDGAILQARLRDERLGLVGDVAGVDLGPVRALTEAGYLVVLAPVGSGPAGQPLNVNADTAAGEVARALRAEELILFTDVPGVLDRNGQVISRIRLSDIEPFKAAGVIRGGMLPKLEACAAALETVRRARIIDGRTPHALVRELFTDQGTGTTVAQIQDEVA